MKKVIIFIILLAFSIVPVKALETTSKSAILYDMETGRILYSKNIHERRLIASITKIMTAVIAIENGDPNKVVTVGEEVLTMYGSNIYLNLHEQMTLKDLLYGLLLRSGNDAAIVIATHIGTNEENFVKMMNQKAKEIGMTNTTYNNSHGLDEVTKNYSTAYDMALLSTYASKHFLYNQIVSTKNYTTKSSTKTYIWENRNKLLSSYKYATGGKTGYTPSAGRTLVTTSFSPSTNLSLTAVTLNDPNEYVTHRNLYEYAYANYKRYTIINKDTFNISKSYIKDKVYLTSSFKYALKEEEKDQIKIKIFLNTQKEYKNNDVVGLLKVYLKEKEIYNDDVFVTVEKKNTSFFEKIINWWNKYVK